MPHILKKITDHRVLSVLNIISERFQTVNLDLALVIRGGCLGSTLTSDF